MGKKRRNEAVKHTDASIKKPEKNLDFERTLKRLIKNKSQKEIDKLLVEYVEQGRPVTTFVEEEAKEPSPRFVIYVLDLTFCI